MSSECPDIVLCGVKRRKCTSGSKLQPMKNICCQTISDHNNRTVLDTRKTTSETVIFLKIKLYLKWHLLVTLRNFFVLYAQLSAPKHRSENRHILSPYFVHHTFQHESESLTSNPEVPVSIPGSTVGIFLERDDSRSYYGLGRLVEFMFKGPPGTPSSYITTHIIGTT